MKLGRIRNDQIVTIRFGDRHCAIAEAHELKRVGLGARKVTGRFWGEWVLRVRTQREFQRLAKHIPQEWVLLHDHKAPRLIS